MLRVIEEAQTGFEPVNNGFAIRHDGPTSDSASDTNSHHTNDLRDDVKKSLVSGRQLVDEKMATEQQRMASIEDWLEASPVDLPPPWRRVVRAPLAAACTTAVSSAPTSA